MKKVKSLVLAFCLMMVTVILTACGTITVSFATYGGNQIESVQIGKEDSEKVQEELNKILKSGYEIEGVYYDSSYTNRWSADDKLEQDTTLHIKWIGREYNVVFNANGGTGDMTNQAIRFHESANLTANAFTKTGYRFYRWAKTSNETDETKMMLDGATFEMNTQGVTLYAIWKVNSYSVSFNANGGTGTMEPQLYVYDLTQNLTKNTFVRTGYNFVGWNTSADGTGTSYTDEQAYTMNSLGTTLYAKWEIISSDVKFNANGGTGTMDDIELDYNESVLLPNNIFERTGYRFVKWTTNQDGTGTSYTNNESITMGLNDITLYAQWAKNTYAVVFDKNGGEGAIDNKSMLYLDKANLTKNTFTKVGYDFAGWNTSADGTGTSYADEAEFTMNVLGQTLYAQWTIKKFTVVFKNEGNTLLTLNNVAYGTAFNEATGYDADALNIINTGAPQGKVYGGFYTSNDTNKETRYDVNSVMADIGNNGTTLEIYLFWAIQTGNVNINYNDATGGNTITNIDVSYNQAIGNLPVPTKTDYTFIGWYSSETVFTNATKVTEETVWVDNFTNIYAKWLSNSQTYALSYELNDGTATATLPTTYNTTSVVVEIPALEKTGYDFNGWKLEENAYLNGIEQLANYVLPKNQQGKQYIPLNSWGEIKLVAVFTAKTYSVVFKNSANENILALQNVQFGTAFNVHSSFNQATFDLAFDEAPTGKEYDCFYASTDTEKETKIYLNTTMYDIGETGTELVLNISWKWLEGEIAFNYDEATGGNDLPTLDVVYNSAIGTLPTPTKTDNVFIGWYSSNTEFSEETKVTAETIWTNDFSTIYAKWVLANEEYNIIYDLNNGFYSDVEPSTRYKSKDGYVICDAHRLGYDFIGWQLVEDAYLNGVFVAGGTYLPVNENSFHYIPKLSFGNVRVVANWQIQIHGVTYKIRNAQDTDWVEYGRFFADYMTDVTLLDEYNSIKYTVSMAKSGYAFDGWYTSYTTFDNTTKFDNHISHADIIVYPHYIAVLSAPQNVRIAQESTIIYWDEVAGADYYELVIDGGEAVRADINSYETGLLLAIADDYEIKVKAMSNYVGVINENINSAYTTYNFTRNANLVNSLLDIRNASDELVKYVLFTGMSYTWESSAYQVEIADASTTDLVNVQVTTVAGKYQSKVTTLNKPGTFRFIINYTQEGRPNEEYLAQVVEDVESVAYGEAYGQYLTSIDPNKTTYLDKVNITPYLVGTSNGFKLDFDLKKGETIYSNFNFLDEELLKYEFEVKEDGVYKEATSSEIPTRLTSDDIAEGSLDEVGMFKFAPENVDKEYRVTVKFMYTKIGTQSNPLGTISNTFELKLNNGWNAHTHEQLKKYYADDEIHEVNILRNITAVLSADQMQEDGSPINIGSGRVFNSDDLTSDNKTTGDVRKTDGNVYKRAYTNIIGDYVTVNGNYCTVDASNIPVVNDEYSLSYGSADDGVNHQVGCISSTETFRLLRPHVGVFRYQSPYGLGATFNNLEVLGNKSARPLGAKPTDEDYAAVYQARATEDSGSYSAFWSETSIMNFNNVIMKNVHHGIRADGALKRFVSGRDSNDESTWLYNKETNPNYCVPNNAKIEMNYVYVSGAYCNAAYSWEGKSIKVYNSYIGQINGPAIQIDNESTPTKALFVIDNNTVCDNWLVGSESWFTLWGLATLAEQLKMALEPVMNNMQVSVLKEQANGSEATNFVFVFRPGNNTSARVIEDGTTVPNAEQAATCTTYIGGVKTVIEGETLSTGVRTERNVSHNFSSDPRISNYLHAFPITTAVTTEQFNNMISIITKLLTETSWQTPAIGYAFNQPNAWLGAQALEVSTGVTLGSLITETEYATLVNNFWEYGIVREAIVSQGILALDKTTYSGYYNAICSGIATQLGLPADYIKMKLTSAMFENYWTLNQKATLFSLNSLQTSVASAVISAGGSQAQAEAQAKTVVGSFMLIKNCENPDVIRRVIELGMPLDSGNGLQLVYVEFGFLDEEGWGVE